MVADLNVEVRLFANLRELAKTKAVVEDVKIGTSVGDVLQKICERFGTKFCGQVLDRHGQPNENVKILLNGRNIIFLQNTATKLKDGDVIAIFPPVGGGFGNVSNRALSTSGGTTVAYYKEKAFNVVENVYEPAEDTFLLADNLDANPGERILELGTGCGLLAILAAKAGARVIATDMNPAALECARANAAAHDVADSIDFRLGDLFEPVAGERFDLVIFNPPYLPIKQNEALSTPLDLAWEAGPEGRAVIDPFLRELPNHLVDSGRALFVQSSLSNLERTLLKLHGHGFSVNIMRKKLPFEELFLLHCF